MLLEEKKKERTGASVNVYLILLKNDEVLVQLRQGTGYCDGYYGLVAGHVEEGESARAAMVREAYEEAGILIDPMCLPIAHVMHRMTDRCNIDLFFECRKWRGDIVNREPEKCGALFFAPLHKLPLNTVDYVEEALDAFAQQTFYSESGW